MKFTQFIFFILFILVSKYSNSQSIEYSVKSLYIEKFARFTEWDTKIVGDNFVIAVLGVSPFTGELEKLAGKTKIKNKPIKIIYTKNIADAKECNLMFICASEKSNISEIIKQIENLNILTIADTPGFCKKGIHLNFYLDDSETIKFEVNPVALKKNDLTVDMQLLNYGNIVN